MVADTSVSDSPHPEAEAIFKLQRQAKRSFQIKLALTWFFLLALLAILFSGIEFNIARISIKFIKLDPEFIKKFGPFIAEGIIQTIYISFASIVFATILALFAALARISNNPPLVALSSFYTSLIRGTPLYLQIIFFFLALPQMGIRLSGFSAGVLALSLNYGAYMSEIFRAGILAVGSGQREAATALGMKARHVMRLIILPQAMRFAIPPIGNQFIAMLKDSALVSITGFVREILWRAQKVGRSNFRNLEALLIAAFFYWILTLLFTAVQTRLEAHFSQGEK